MWKITLFILSFSNFTNCCEQADFKPLSTFLLFNNPQIKKKKKENKANSKHALQMRLRFRSFRPIWSKLRFLTSQSKKNDDSFVLRDLLTITKHCKNEKQNKWSWNFISFLVCFHHCRKERKERKEKIVKFIFIFQQTTSIHSHSFNIIKPIKSITTNPRWEWEEEKVKMNIINNHRTNRNPIV